MQCNAMQMQMQMQRSAMQPSATQCTMVRRLKEDSPAHTHTHHTPPHPPLKGSGGETSLSPPPLHLSSHISSPSIPGLGGKGNLPKHCNRFALQCNQSALHCSRLAIAALWHRPHCIAIALDCNRIASHCIRFALRGNRTALQSHCVAIASFLLPPSWPPGPRGRTHLPSPSPRTSPPFFPWALGKTEDEGGRRPNSAIALRRIAIAARCVAVALQQPPYCNRPIALQSHRHCNRIAARCDRIALQSHCNALALRRVAVQ